MSDFRDLSEFKDFMQGEERQPPGALSARIRDEVQRDLQSGSFSVGLLSKLALIHAAAGAATLLACPQFGVSFISEGLGLMDVFMVLGHEACMVACGAFFTGTSLLVSSLLLKRSELARVRRSRWSVPALLASASALVLTMAGGELALAEGLFWGSGALLGGTAFIELGWAIRRLAHAKALP